MISSGVRPFHDIFPPNMLPLGFGCGGLYGGATRQDSLKLLETAIDCGIRYFDTARLYGFGEAEGLLGEIAARDRHRLIITSKAGILPANRSIPIRLLNRATRLLHKIPHAARYIRAPAAARLRFHVFSLPELRASIQTSLKQLRTDYLDILLLHECALADIESGEILSFLERLRSEGVIRAFGLATGIDETQQIIASHPELTRVVQIPNSMLDMNISRLPQRDDGLTILHSVLAGKIPALLARLSTDAVFGTEFLAATGIGPRDRETIVQLILSHALDCNSGGIVLFSSSKPSNIKSNMRVLQQPARDRHQIDALASFFGSSASGDGA